MSKILVYIFHTGRVQVDRAIPLREKNPLALICTQYSGHSR